jgi:hypothetical protein
VIVASRNPFYWLRCQLISSVDCLGIRTYLNSLCIGCRILLFRGLRVVSGDRWWDKFHGEFSRGSGRDIYFFL